MTTNKFGKGTDVGCTRDHNEDTVLAEPNSGLWVVADGMGGHEAGEVASAVAVATVRAAVAEGESLAAAINRAHKAVLNEGRKREGRRGMGCTCVAVQIRGHRCDVAWVGDSRAYLWSNGLLLRITHDHSYVQSLLDVGAISEQEALVHPDRSVLTQCLGSLKLDDLQVDVVREDFCAGEKLLLCSDGLTSELSDAEIAALLKDTEDDQVAVDRLILAALAHGGSDNVSVVVISAKPDAPLRSSGGASSTKGGGSKTAPQPIVIEPDVSAGLARRWRLPWVTDSST